MNKLSRKSKKNLDNYKKVIGYSEEPFHCICDADFVEYVKKMNKKPVIEVLEQFLGVKIEMHSTPCINLTVKGMFGTPGNHPAITQPCEHTPDRPQYATHICMKTFVRDYPSRFLVVCCYHKPDYDYYKLAPAIILITPDSKMKGGIKLASIAKVSFGRPPPEISIMDGYTRLFGFRSPFPTICEPGFEGYVQGTGSSLTDALEALLGGEIKLLSTWCEDCGEIFDRATGCGHVGCIRKFVSEYPSRALVVCTLENRDHYARVPGRIVVTPNRLRNGVMIDTEPLPSIIEHLRWLKQVKRTRFNLFERLRDEMFNRISKTKEPNLNLIVSPKNGKEKFHYTSASDAAQKMIEIASDGMHQPKDVLDAGINFDILQLEEDPSVRILVNKAKGKRKIDYSEAETSAKRQKYDDVEMLQTPATAQTTGTKTVFMGNLSFSIKKNDIVNFFKEVGEVADIRFAMRDERFAGYGHVEFTTSDAAQKAIEFNEAVLHGRVVRIDLAKERGKRSAYTPGRNEGYQKSAGQELTVHVRGFGKDNDFDTIRVTLEGHFGGCGEMTRLSIPKDFESGGPKGFAFISFADDTGFNKALELSGTEINGDIITVEIAKPRVDRGLVGGRGSEGVGSYDSRRFDRGRGSDSGGHGRGHEPGTGKKTSVDD